MKRQADGPPPGRPQEDDIGYRLDAGPPPKPGGIMIPLVSIPLDKVVGYFRRLIRR